MEYYIVLLGILVIPLIAQLYVSATYKKNKTIELNKKISGFEVARAILDDNGLNSIYIVETKGTLSDHYDPKQKVVRLSTDIYHGESVAACAIAAHECGHALQDKEGYAYMKFRSFIFPVVRIATQVSYGIILVAIILEMLNLLLLGIGFVSLGLLFQLITLPVEFDASKRAKKLLNKLSITTEDENKKASSVLSAAAMTYVAGVLASALEILRLVMIYNNRRR